MLFSTKPLPYNVRRVFPARTPLLKISGTAFLSIFRKRSTLGPAATVVQLLLNLPRLMSSSAAASASASQSSAQTPVKVRSGSCLCRSVTYEVTGEPFTMRVCHCGNCQKATGAAFMTNAFFRDNVCFLAILILCDICTPFHALHVPPHLEKLHRYVSRSCIFHGLRQLRFICPVAQYPKADHLCLLVFRFWQRRLTACLFV